MLFKISLVDKISSSLINIQKKIGKVTDGFEKTTKAGEQFGKVIGDNLTATLLKFNQLNQSLQSVSGTVNSVVDITAKYSDALADVQKTTGLGSDAAKELQSELEQITTRTGVLELMNISRVAGEFGEKSVKSVKSFTQSVNLANVALGDQFGNNAETVARELGKLRNLYGDTKNMQYAQAITRIGSSLNQLGNELGTNAGNLTDFAKRLGQVGKLGPTLTQNLGIGATLEKLGIDSEVASSGLMKVFLNGAKESKAFAAQLGMTENAFVAMTQKSPNEMLLKLLKSFKGLSSHAIVKNLEKLKLGTDQESIKVFQALAANIEKLEANQRTANEAFAEGTSIKQEAALMENTFAAKIERTKKAAERITVAFGNYAQAYLPAIQTTAMLSTTFSNLLPLFSYGGKLVFWFGKNIRKNTLAVIKFSSALLINATKSVGSFIMQVVRAIAAQTGLNLAMSANPLGLVIVGLTAVGTAVYGIIKHWDVVKKWLIDLGMFMLKMNPFYWLIQGIDMLFPGFIEKLKSWWNAIGGFFKKIGGWFVKIWNEYLAPLFGLEKQPEMQTGSLDDLNLSGANSPNNISSDIVPPVNTNDNINKKISTGVSGINTSGSKSINISFGKLIEQFNINTQNITEGYAEMETLTIESLLRVLNQANMMA